MQGGQRQSQNVRSRPAATAGSDSRQRPARTLSGALPALALVMLFGGIIAAIVWPAFVRAWALAGQECVPQPDARTGDYSSPDDRVVFYEADEHGSADAAGRPEQLEPYVKDRMLYRCPTDDSGADVSYGMEVTYGREDAGAFPDRAERVLFLDVDGSGRPTARHNGGTNCAFLDGHVKWPTGVPRGIGPAGDGTSPNGPPILTVPSPQSTR